MAPIEENGFLEYLQLQGGSTDLVTKSELISSVREQGFSLGSRQLTFYTSEGLVPKSARVGSRAGAYPKIVVNLLTWIVAARDAGVSIDALKELLPVWKFLNRAREAHRLDVAELEYVARQYVSSTEGSMGVPRVVSWVMTAQCCPRCQPEIEIIYKDGSRKSLSDPEATLGFAIAHTPVDDGETSPRAQWYASTRLSLGHQRQHSNDPTTVILGIKPNDELPLDETDTSSPTHKGADQTT
ncbi:MerR family transcriptional regulator [Gordonia polyisoprenivorans]|uniref:helix-turn-helix domain-containing protein n=1 Tax=Gordonia polyisoprenivorans TaxID=84595 RepID=UPI0012DD0A97|nr:MerR family transcriptional regulator [Gordonia polyisoprenivorans]